MPNSVGRPTKFTPERAEKICNALARGMSREAAAGLAGVHYTTFRDWELRGIDGRDGYLEFYNAVKKAEAEFEERHVAIIDQATATTWQAAAWLLERRQPQRWAKMERHEVSGPDGGPVIVKGYGGFKPDEWPKETSRISGNGKNGNNRKT